MFARLPSATTRSIAALCSALMLVLCVQFVVVATDRIEHRFGLAHAPAFSTGTVIDHDAADASHAVDRGAENGDGLDREHATEAAEGDVLPAAFVALSLHGLMALNATKTQFIMGLSGCTPERPPNVL
jgi:predicted cobalt transporter CbtA